MITNPNPFTQFATIIAANLHAAVKQVSKKRAQYNRLIGNRDPLIQFVVASIGEALIIRQARQLIVNDVFGAVAAVLIVVFQGGIAKSEVNNSLLALFPVISIAFKLVVIGWKLNLFRRRFELRQEIEETAYHLLENDMRSQDDLENKIIDLTMSATKDDKAKEAFKKNVRESVEMSRRASLAVPSGAKKSLGSFNTKKSPSSIHQMKSKWKLTTMKY